ncbi:MAG TPA: NAD(P)-binding protein [Xanthomonadales bacterium]|nr:NAD(P)-binding protein [Xanthomonadales bacterium]
MSKLRGSRIPGTTEPATRTKRDITRRDFIHDVSLGALGISMPITLMASAAGEGGASVYYPPTLTGLRGSHPGSYEVAHALAREKKTFEAPRVLDEKYDLIVVGGGLSGLAAAYFYRQLHGADSRILVLDNHDDFGGHAKRNEFHQGGPMRLAWGGTVNMEYTKYSKVAKGLLDDLGVNIPRLLKDFKFRWMNNGSGLQPSTWFNPDIFGRNVVLPGMQINRLPPQELAEHVETFPISPEAQSALKKFLLASEDVLAGMNLAQKQAYLSRTSYSDFLRQHFELPDEAISLFSPLTMGFWGVRANNLSVAECLESGLPGWHVLGEFVQSAEENAAGPSPSAMFPDGNASLARLLVRSLIPGSVPGMAPDSDPFDIVTAKLDYAQLDKPSSPVRLRLNATAIHANNTPDGSGVNVNYVVGGEVLQVRGKSSVLACYNNIIPYLCPQLPEAQKAALAMSIRRPMLIMNVALRNGKALQKSGLSGASLNGSICQGMTLVTGINVGAYHPEWNPDETCVVQFYGAVEAPNPEGLTITQQNQAGRLRLLEMSFDDFERDIRTAMIGVWGSSGFDPDEDILAITVDRWPHGYARDHLDLEDPAWNTNPPPNVIGRKTFGNIAIANSDAGADAYTHTAFDQAWRAVQSLG